MVDDRLESGRTLEALRKKNLEGKKMFIEELRKQKTPKAVSLLLEILCDESWYLRELAIGALVEAGTPAEAPLHKVLTGGLWYTRAAAARALGRLGYAPAAPDVLKLLDEPNRTVRESAVDAIKALMAAGCTAPVCEALAGAPREVRSARLSLISQGAPEMATQLEAGVESLQAARLAIPTAAPAGEDAAPENAAAPPESATGPRASDSAHAGGEGSPGPSS